MLVFHLVEDDFEEQTIFEVKESLRLKDGGDLMVQPGRVALGFSFDPTTITPIASLLVSIISLCVTLRREKSSAQAKNDWTPERLQSLLKTELLKAGVTQYSDIAVDNFSALTERTEQPCEVAVKDERSKKRLMFHIFHDGDVYRIGRK